MARYRKIDSRIWGDEKFRSLSKPKPNAQTLWFYLLTGPHTNGCPGLYNVGPMAISESLGWQSKDFLKVFREVLDKGMAKADFESRVILIPRAIFYDPPENPNVLKKWARDYDEIPECALKNEYYHVLKGFIKDFGKLFNEVFIKDFRESITITITRTITIPLPETESGKTLENGEMGNNSSLEISLSKLLFQKIQQRDPKAKEPNWEVWVNDMRLLINRDQRDPVEIEAVIIWCQDDNFWQNNILSPGKLREQFTQLILKMGKGKKQDGIDKGTQRIKDELNKQKPKGIEHNPG